MFEYSCNLSIDIRIRYSTIKTAVMLSSFSLLQPGSPSGEHPHCRQNIKKTTGTNISKYVLKIKCTVVFKTLIDTVPVFTAVSSKIDMMKRNYCFTSIET